MDHPVLDPLMVHLSRIAHIFVHLNSDVRVRRIDHCLDHLLAGLSLAFCPVSMQVVEASERVEQLEKQLEQQVLRNELMESQHVRVNQFVYGLWC